MDGEQVNSIFAILTSMGLPGLVIAVLGWHDWQIQKRNQELNDAMRDMVRDTTTAIVNNTNAINRIGDMVIRGKVPE